MAKQKQNDMVKAEDQTIVIPEWMKDEVIEGVETVAEFQTTPRIAIVQAMSQPERKELVGEGGVAIMPDGVAVAKKDEEFVVIPLVFWPTWEVHSDINDTSSPFVMESTSDANSQIARLSKGRDTRNESYGEGFSKKYLECLNFVVRIESGPATGELGTLTFSGGEHYTGSKLCGLLKRRSCSIYANRIALSTAMRQRNNKSWWGFDIANPEDGAVVSDKETYDTLAEIHKGLARMVDTSKLLVSRDEKVAGAQGSLDTLPI